MKILHVCKSRSYSFMSGVEIAVENLVSSISTLGEDVYLLTGTKPNHNKGNDIIPPVKIIHLPYFPGRHSPVWKNFFEELSFNIQAYRWFKKNGQQFDIIHLHGRSGIWFPFDVVKKPKVVVTVHGLLDVENDQNKVGNSFERKIHEHLIINLEKKTFNRADLVISVSNFLAQQICDLREMNMENISIITNGVRVPDSVPDISQDRKMLLYIGRLKKIKGLYQVLKAMKKVDHFITLKIIGSGEEEKNIDKYISDHGLKTRIQILGQKNQSEIWHWLQKSIALIVPSLSDPFAIVKLEAFAAKRPVLISNRPGVSDGIQHLITGLMFDPENVDQIASTIQYCADHPQEMQLMGEKGYQQVIEKFQWTDIAKQTLRLYQKNSHDARANVLDS